MKKEELMNTWKKFVQDKDFMLNPDQEHIEGIAEGVLANEKNYGLRLCPCRLRDGTRERDLQLICPCNFKIQENWDKKGECWCGLFVKRN